MSELSFPELDDAEMLTATRAETANEVIDTATISGDTVLVKVKGWTPPTPDHAGLHEFMRTQIEQSIDFDCNESYCSTPTVRLTGEAWAASERARCLRDVKYHEKEHAGEVSRAATRTEWVRALRAAL